ncbi:MAG TPA: hypothetical protein VKE41_19105 [Roseiflexaceae bacterium]|nr:hypothetical protein [Roseiflexaceae bacterium]
MAWRRQTPHAQPIHGQFLAIAHDDVGLAGLEYSLHCVADTALVTGGERLSGLGRTDDLETTPLQFGGVAGVVKVRVGNEEVRSLFEMKALSRCVLLDLWQCLGILQITRVDQHTGAGGMDQIAVLMPAVWRTIHQIDAREYLHHLPPRYECILRSSKHHN